VLAIMDLLHLPRPVVGGLSMGGYVTFAIWRLAAERCRALVLADTKASADTDQGRAARDKMIELTEREGTGRVADEMLPKLLGETTRETQPEVVDRAWRMVDRQTRGAVVGALVRLRDRPDSTPLLPAIGVPVAVIVGEEDVVTPPSDSEAMRAALPKAALTKIPRAGHLANLENPAAFNEALSSFLSGVRA
jgi:3-oxoadipate enol-lactonase